MADTEETKVREFMLLSIPWAQKKMREAQVIFALFYLSFVFVQVFGVLETSQFN